LDDFAVLAESIRRVFPASRFECLSEAQVGEIRRDHPEVPEHYLEFRRRIGWGSLGSNFKVYSGLCKPNEFFDAETASQLDGVLFVGDDFGGWMVGFDTRQAWRLVGVDSVSLEPEPLAQGSLRELIADRIADHEGTV
jgi:hypothetical protein